jgi:hypothetical protein
MCSYYVQGYHGAAAGKGKQLAKTELEKLKLSEMTTREAVFAAAKMYVYCFPMIYYLSHSSCAQNLSGTRRVEREGI